MDLNLYREAELYAAVFPVDGEETEFFRHWTSAAPGVALDAGAGSGLLARALAPLPLLSLDRELPFLRFAPPPALAADLDALPFRDHSLPLIVSRLHSLAYAAAASPNVHHEILRVLAPGGRLVADIPLSANPANLVGVTEDARTRPGVRYRFTYGDLLRTTPRGAVLDSRISVETAGSLHVVDVPIHVYTPGGAREILGTAPRTRFFAPYDLASECHLPPADASRAVVVVDL